MTTELQKLRAHYELLPAHVQARKTAQSLLMAIQIAEAREELVDELERIRQDNGGCWPWCSFVLADAGRCNCHNFPLSRLLARVTKEGE